MEVAVMNWAVNFMSSFTAPFIVFELIGYSERLEKYGTFKTGVQSTEFEWKLLFIQWRGMDREFWLFSCMSAHFYYFLQLLSHPTSIVTAKQSCSWWRTLKFDNVNVSNIPFIIRNEQITKRTSIRDPRMSHGFLF